MIRTGLAFQVGLTFAPDWPPTLGARRSRRFTVRHEICLRIFVHASHNLTLKRPEGRAPTSPNGLTSAFVQLRRYRFAQKRQRTGALQNASRCRWSQKSAPASWTAAALHRFLTERSLGRNSGGESALISRSPEMYGRLTSVTTTGQRRRSVVAITAPRARVSWTAAGSAAPRRFRTRESGRHSEGHPPPKSCVAATALPPHSKTLQTIPDSTGLPSLRPGLVRARQARD